MTQIDEFARRLNIERRIGKATSYSLLKRPGNEPHHRILEEAKRQLTREIDLYLVQGGLPDNAYLSGFDNHLIILSNRHLEMSLLLRDMIVDDTLAYFRIEFANKICLRIMAELSLRHGIGEWTTPALLKSITGLNSYTPKQYTLETAADRMSGEEFIPTCFFGLAHELGHGFVAETVTSAEQLITDSTLHEMLVSALESFRDYPDTLKEKALVFFTENRERSPLGLSHLRKEALADMFAIGVLLSSAVDFQRQRGEGFDIELFTEALTIIFNAIILIERCKRTVLVYNNRNSETMKLATLLIPVAFKVRALLWTKHLAIQMSWHLSGNKEETLDLFDTVLANIGKINTQLEDTVAEFESGLAKAMRFVLFPNERSHRSLSEYQADIQSDTSSPVLGEGRRFLALAKSFDTRADFIQELENIFGK